MYRIMYVKSFVIAFLVLTVLMVSRGQAVEITTNTTWSSGAAFDDGDAVKVVNGSTVTVNGNTLIDNSGSAPVTKSLSALALGGESASGTEDGDGTLRVTSLGSIMIDRLILGEESGSSYNGNLIMQAGSAFLVNDEIVFNKGTVTNNNTGTQNWGALNLTWNNTDAIVFDGTGTINFGSKASGESLEIADGTLITSGDTDANNYTLTGGTLQVNNGIFTYDSDLTAGGTVIELDGSSWTLNDTQEVTDGEIILKDTTLTLGADTNYDGKAGSFSMEGSSTINLNDHDLNLGDADNFTIEDGKHFISKSLGGSTLSWNSGKIRGTKDTFFTGFSVDDVNVDMSGDAVLEIYKTTETTQDHKYTVVYDFSLADTATVVGEDMTLFVQGGADINSTDGTNTAAFTFLGRSEDAVIINSQATFEGSILISDVYDDASKTNEVIDGVFDGEVAVQNWNDESPDSIGAGHTEISGGTFNNLVTLNLLRKTDLEEGEEDEQNKATISGGDFNDTVKYQGLADVISEDEDGKEVTTIRMGNAIITGGAFDSLELVAGSGSGTLTIAESVDVDGTDGVKLNAAILSIEADKILDVTGGDFLMDEDGTGTLAGSGTIRVGDFYLKSGNVIGNVKIDGDVKQTGGTISPGDEAGEIGQIDVTGDLDLMNAVIDLKEDGTSDLIVVGGQTTLDADGVMTVKPDFSATKITVGREYTVIESAGGIVDLGYSVDLGIAGFSATGSIVDDTDYVITLQRAIHTFPRGARNANNFVTYLYDLYDEGEHKEKLMAALASDSNQQLAAEKLSGESHQTGLQSLMNVGMMRVHTLTEQIRPSMSSRFFESGVADDSEVTARGQFDPHATFERTRIWYAAYGMGGHIVGNENTSSTEVTFAGMMVGIEGTFDAGSAKVGLYYDRSGVENDVNLLSAKTNIKTNFFGGYLTRELENGYRLFTFGFGEDRYSSRRFLDIGSGTDRISELAKSGYHGWQSMLYAERGFDSLGRFYGIQPYLGLQYSYIRRNSFDETGDSSNENNTSYAALDMEATNYDSLRSYLGARWETPFYQLGHDKKTGMMLGGTFQIQTAWIHEMLDKASPICSAQLGSSGLANSFVVEGADCGRDWYLLSLGAKWQLAKAFSFYGDYTVLVNSRQTFHTGSGGLCLSW